MKKLFKISITPILMMVFTMVSCSKDDTAGTPGGGGGGGGTVKGTAQFSINGTSFVADSVNASTSAKAIAIYKDQASTTDNKLLYITLSSFAVGSYALSSTTPNVIKYTLGGTVLFTSESGTVNITSNTGTVLNGNYNAIMNGGTAFTGTFSNVAIR
ncbi:MAG: hypothetical protein ABIY51_01990 [Ferruginibacter sp.]